MLPPLMPLSEDDRLAALRSYDVLDTACEASFDNIARLAADLTESPISMVSLVDAERAWFKAHHGLEAPEAPREHAFCAHAILEPGTPLVIPDASRDPRFAGNPLVTGAPDIRFYAGVPLVNPEGAVLGTLCVLDRKPRRMSAERQRILVRLAEAVMTTLELRRAMNRVHRLSMTDALTGLLNRPALMDALDKAVARLNRHGEGFALLYLDLDGFKQVNDREGHATGDEVLRELAAVLWDNLRREDMAARLGGDEFAVLLTGREPDAAIVAERLQRMLEAAMRAKGWAVTASIGAVSFHNAPESVDAALSLADSLMYGAKAAGRNRVLHRDH